MFKIWKKYIIITTLIKNVQAIQLKKQKLERMILEELKVDEIARNYLYEKVNVIYYINNDKTISANYK